MGVALKVHRFLFSNAKKKGTLERRFFVVDRRDQDILIPIIQNEMLSGRKLA